MTDDAESHFAEIAGRQLSRSSIEPACLSRITDVRFASKPATTAIIYAFYTTTHAIKKQPTKQKTPALCSCKTLPIFTTNAMPT
jgi:hypothetical protein